MKPITPANLESEGFQLVVQGNNRYYKKDNIQVINTGLAWQICDIDGNVGNSYVTSIEEIYAESSR